MKRWHWALLIAGGAIAIVFEVVSWGLATTAFWILPSWIFIAIMMHLLPWPRSVYVAAVIGLLIDLYAPAPFGLWMLSSMLLVTVGQWMHTTWIKQASALSVLAAILAGVVAATIPLWVWQILAQRSPVVSEAILMVHWWQWPLGWLMMSLIAAIIIRIIPSRYERFV